MKKLTPADIRDPQRKSGYTYVTYDTSDRNRIKRYRGQPGIGLTHGEPSSHTSTKRWRGPARLTALEAAQDYCDYVNGLPLSQRPKKLKTAGHKRSPRTPRQGPTPIEQKIAAMEKELRGLKRQREKESEGRQGYVYCIGEDPDSGGYPQDGGYIVFTNPTPDGRRSWRGSVRAVLPADALVIGERGVKIGHAVDPHKRIAELQTGNPRKLILLGYIKGTMEDEARFHQRFHKDNVLQEWFRPSRELLSLFVNKEG